MTEFDPAPRPTYAAPVADGDETHLVGVYDVVLSVTSPTAYTEIHWSLRTALRCRKRSTSTAWRRWASPEPIESNKAQQRIRTKQGGYLRWRDAVESRNQSSLSKRSSTAWRRLNLSEPECEAQFETTDPTAVNVFDHDSHETIHERMTAKSASGGA